MRGITSKSMSNYRRNYVPGGTYFFTVMTYRRRPILATELARMSLRNAIEKIRRRWQFEIVAIVLLPDHSHTVWTLPRGDSDYSLRIRRIKEEFSRSYLAGGGQELPLNKSRASRGERAIWQRRFWEHTIDDEDDLKRCVDYVHWNPQKHGLVSSVRDWRWSTFHCFVELGEYTLDWGRKDPTPGFDTPEWAHFTND
jgi:REP-associated tyrosine transposase